MVAYSFKKGCLDYYGLYTRDTDPANANIQDENV